MRRAAIDSARRYHSHAIAGLEHEPGVREQHGIAAAHVDELRVEVRRKRHLTERHARQRRARDEKPCDVQRSPILRQVAAFDAPELPLGLRQRLGPAEQQHAVARAEPNPGIGQLVRLPLADGHQVRALGQEPDQVRDRGVLLLAAQARSSSGSSGCRLRRQARPHEPREHEEAQNRPDDANRIRDGIPERRLAAPGSVDGGLQGRRAGQRARKEADRMNGRDPCRPAQHEARRQRTQDACRAEDIPRQPRPAQAGEELAAVLDADAVEKHHEADRAHQCRRRAAGCNRTQRQAGEEDGPDVEREAAD